jgi:hypothetical protein
VSTIAWIFILLGILIVRGVSKGRVMELPQDLSDAFLALVNGDQETLGEALGRTGAGNVADVGANVGGTVDSVTGIGAAMGAALTSLGNVKPHVLAGASEIANRFGITNVGGYRSKGSVPNSDHPKGLAVDLMTKDKAKGDAIAAYALANASRLKVKYVIWWGQINNGSGWKKYNGPSDHKDHVHISFNA